MKKVKSQYRRSSSQCNQESYESTLELTSQYRRSSSQCNLITITKL